MKNNQSQILNKKRGRLLPLFLYTSDFFKLLNNICLFTSFFVKINTKLMRKIILSSLIALIVGFIFSCKKEEITEPIVVVQNTTSYPNFSKFNIGSYWVYQQYIIDTLGNETPTNIYDSCFVETDTVVNGVTYGVINKPNTVNITNQPRIRHLTRDSLHYIIGLGGQILFSSEDFQSIFDSHYNVIGVDTIYQVITRMVNKDVSVNTPTGLFITSDYVQEYYYLHYPTFDNPRVMHTKYAKNVGVVIETIPFFTTNPNYTERRLVRYHISN
jgi:hypothetical protein